MKFIIKAIRTKRRLRSSRVERLELYIHLIREKVQVERIKTLKLKINPATCSIIYMSYYSLNFGTGSRCDNGEWKFPGARWTDRRDGITKVRDAIQHRGHTCAQRVTTVIL